MSRLPISGVVLLFLSSLSPYVAAQDEGLVATVAAAHAASVASMRSFSCEMKIEHVPTNKPFGTERVKQWQEGDVIRSKYESDIAKQDMLIQGMHVRQVHTRWAKGSAQEGQGSFGHGKFKVRSDPWRFALFKFAGHERKDIPFQQLLANPHQVEAAEKVRAEGRELIHLALSHKLAQLELWFDPSVNYLVRKYRARADPFELVESVQRFEEVRPGLFFPMVVKSEWRQQGKHVWYRTVTFTNVTINEPFPAELRELRFPADLTVQDYDKGELKKTDKNGEPTLPATDSDGNPLKLVIAPPMVSPPTKPMTPSTTQEEPRSWTRWLLPGSLSLLVVGGGLALIRKLRARRTVTP
jgi:hypothetical protein